MLFTNQTPFCIHDQINCQDTLCDKCFNYKLVGIPQNPCARIDFSDEIFRNTVMDKKTYQNFQEEFRTGQHLRANPKQSSLEKWIQIQLKYMIRIF